MSKRKVEEVNNNQDGNTADSRSRIDTNTNVATGLTLAAGVFGAVAGGYYTNNVAFAAMQFIPGITPTIHAITVASSAAVGTAISTLAVFSAGAAYDYFNPNAIIQNNIAVNAEVVNPEEENHDKVDVIVEASNHTIAQIDIDPNKPEEEDTHITTKDNTKKTKKAPKGDSPSNLKTNNDKNDPDGDEDEAGTDNSPSSHEATKTEKVSSTSKTRSSLSGENNSAKGNSSTKTKKNDMKSFDDEDSFNQNSGENKFSNPGDSNYTNPSNHQNEDDIFYKLALSLAGDSTSAVIEI